ncbi:MAG: thioredoxin family protein [Bacteroidota bacterium]
MLGKKLGILLLILLGENENLHALAISKESVKRHYIDKKNSKSKSMKPVIIDTAQAFKQAIHSEKLVFVEFYKVGCPYCKQIEPLIEAIAEQGLIKVYVMKLTEANKASYKSLYRFSAFPRCALFQNGEKKALLNVKSEVLNKERILTWINQHR